MDASALRRRLARWVWKTQDIPFIILHRPGVGMVLPDMFSRDVFPPPTCPRCQETLVIIREQAGLPTPAELTTSVKAAEVDLSSKGEDIREEDWLLDEEECLRKFISRGTIVYVPPTCRNQVFRYCHGSLAHEHYDISRTVELVHSQFWWSGVKSDVALHIKDCVTRAVGKITQPRRHRLFGRCQVKRRGEIVAIDVLSITPASISGNKVLVMGNALTRFC
jgi:Integrase zinc binding domain